MVKINNLGEKIRFSLVGIANTVIDFAIFLSLGLAGMPAVAANFISTSTAFSFSFFANKKYTFKNDSDNLKKQITLFLLVTLFGLWVLQPIVIYLVKTILADSNYSDGLILVVAKLAATAVTLIWNYVLYSRVVFEARHYN